MYAVEGLRDGLTESKSFLNFCLSFGEVLRLCDIYFTNNIQLFVINVYEVVFAT